MRVVDGLASGKYKVTFDNEIRRVSVIDESRIVYINEDTARDLKNAMKMKTSHYY